MYSNVTAWMIGYPDLAEVEMAIHLRDAGQRRALRESRKPTGSALRRIGDRIATFVGRDGGAPADLACSAC